MHLVMFDIDGTLTETMKVDEECFVRSFDDVFGFTDIDTDWSHYPHSSSLRKEQSKGTEAHLLALFMSATEFGTLAHVAR